MKPSKKHKKESNIPLEVKRKKFIIAALIVISFILLIISVIFFLDKTRDLRRIDPLELEDLSKEEIIQFIYERQDKSSSPNFYFIPVFGFFGIVVGTLIYYIMNGDIEKKEKLIEYNTEIILKLLNPEERKVIKKIVESGGKLQQIEITYMEGFTKVKAHRILEALENKGILFKEKLGKIRIVKINQDFYNILKQK